VASQVAPGALGFLMVASLAVGLFFLLRSMNKQLHKVSADRSYFSEQPEADAAAKPERPGE
jgi:hypothetical protein